MPQKMINALTIQILQCITYECIDINDPLFYNIIHINDIGFIHIK